MTKPDSDLLGHALAYARAGIDVFPLHTNKAPNGALAPNGMKDATNDPTLIEQWWQHSPDALIGGRIPEGIVALDIDPKHNGDATWQALIAELGQGVEPPETRRHYSGRNDGGFHIWFNWPLDETQLHIGKIREWAKAHPDDLGMWLPVTGRNGEPMLDHDGNPKQIYVCGLDILRHGYRYSVLPPSPHPDTGQPYTWHTTGPVADCPDWLVEQLRKPERVETPATPSNTTLTGANPNSSSTPDVDLGESPADWFTAHSTWTEILGSIGWDLISGDGNSDGSKWRRPGSTNPNSASISNGGHLFVYTPNSVFDETEPSNPNGYTRFKAWATINHNGDMSTAAKAVYDLPGAPERPQRTQTANTGLGATIELEAEELNSLFVAGGAFIFDGAEDIVALWGDGDDVLWARGEGLIVAGGIGAGKTTLIGQLLRCRLGLQDELLGMSVLAGERNCLYLASDRPAQISRALRRHFTPTERARLDDRLQVLKGPPPQDLARNPLALVQMARAADADTVFLDSLKDMAGALSDEATGDGLNKAMQHCVADGIEVVANHHGRKATGDNPKPNKLSDVYGSTWLTAGAGSVIYLHGQPGASELELLHLKQPANDVGPLKITHDHRAGVTTLADQWLPLQWLGHVNVHNGVSSSDAARAMTGKTSPSKNDVRKARRILERLVDTGDIERLETPGAAEGSTAISYRLPLDNQRNTKL